MSNQRLQFRSEHRAAIGQFGQIERLDPQTSRASSSCRRSRS
jgi:hypothetical protein